MTPTIPDSVLTIKGTPASRNNFTTLIDQSPRNVRMIEDMREDDGQLQSHFFYDDILRMFHLTHLNTFYTLVKKNLTPVSDDRGFKGLLLSFNVPFLATEPGSRSVRRFVYVSPKIDFNPSYWKKTRI
jgi:hypothetical protein